MLIGAVDTLNLLIATLDSRHTVQVGDQNPASSAPHPLDAEDEVVIDMRTETLKPPSPAKTLQTENDAVTAGSESSSNHGSSEGYDDFLLNARSHLFANRERFSRGSEATSLSRASTQTLSMPISDLERRLATDRTLDIFTMTPKVDPFPLRISVTTNLFSQAVKLQMSPPSLTFTREMRTSLDVLIRFTPRATGVEVIHRQGHIFLLSDLFLVCERILPGDRARVGRENADMSLCYPPLAGKVLRVSEIIGQGQFEPRILY